MSHSERRDQHFWACITIVIGIFIGVVVTMIMLRLGLEWGYQMSNHTECKIKYKNECIQDES